MMSAKSYTLNNGVSIPAVGEHRPARVPIVSSPFKPTAFGGWGGRTDEDRDKFGPTFGLALKVGTSSSFRRFVFTCGLQEGFRHLDGAWIYRTLH